MICDLGRWAVSRDVLVACQLVFRLRNLDRGLDGVVVDIVLLERDDILVCMRASKAREQDQRSRCRRKSRKADWSPA